MQHSRLEILGQQAALSADAGRPSRWPSARAIAEQPDSALTPRPPVQSLYIHVPFCFHKCHYCDFYSFVDTRDQQEAFTDRLIRELAALGRATGRPTLQTIFVGGGTPSLLKVDLWQLLLAALSTHMDLSLIASGHGEFTVECNPETVSAELMATLRGGHVDRVSIGAQSFKPQHLKTLERWHDPENVARAVELARAAGIERQSVDLINAIPGQTEQDWADDLDRALSLGVTHLSCYTLTYEPGTAMTKRLELGNFVPADEELEARMYEHTLARLRQAGFSRYEISNFARSSADQSLHNLAYWRQDQWLAAGPSAGGHLWNQADRRAGSWRWKNVPRLGDYLASEDEGFAPVTDVEAPDPARLLRERLMMGLRLEEGMEASQFLADLDSIRPEQTPRLVQAIDRLKGQDLLRPEPADRWTLTDRGFMLADYLAAQLMRIIA